MSTRLPAFAFSALVLASTALIGQDASAAQPSWRDAHRHGDLYVRKSSPSYLHGAVKEPGSSNRYFSDTREGPPLYTEGSTFVTRGFDLLPDARPF